MRMQTLLLAIAALVASPAAYANDSKAPLQVGDGLTINWDDDILVVSGFWDDALYPEDNGALSTKATRMTDMAALAGETIAPSMIRYGIAPKEDILPIAVAEMPHWAPSPAIIGLEHSWSITEPGVGLNPAIEGTCRIIAANADSCLAVRIDT